MKPSRPTARILTLTLLLWVSGLVTTSTASVPFIDNFGRSDYGSGNSTWRIASYDRWMFFTNEKGLLVYDGLNWEKRPLHNHGEVRGVAVFPDKRRVYVGGENEYGFFEVCPLTGRLDYHCLSDSVERQFRQVGNVWEIYELTNVLVLRCDDHLLTIAGGKYSFIKSDEKMFASVLVDGVIYVATDHGVKMVAGARLLPITNGEVLEGKRINAMFKYGQGMIVTTANDGLFYYDGRTVVPLPTRADSLLRQGVICCAAVRGDVVALGTVQHGLVILDLKTGEVRNYDEHHGLQNNTVLSVGFDREGNVWAGMDYGIDRIMLNAPFAYLYKGRESYGIGYSSATSGGQLYVGTDRGLFAMPFDGSLADSPAELRRVSCPSGPAWYLYKNGDDLFCLHDKGIFLINGLTATKVTDILGAWSCRAVEGRPDLMFVGVYSGVYLIQKRGGRWESLGRIKGISESGRYFRQTGPAQLTVYNRNTGTAVAYSLSPSLLEVVAQKETRQLWDEGPTAPTARLFSEWNVSGRILTFADSTQLIPCSRGFILFDRRKTKRTIQVYIRQVRTTSPADSLCYAANFCDIRPEPVLSYARNAIRIDYGVQLLQIARAVRYSYRLNGGQWSAPTDLTSKEYSNLREGSYTFEVRAVMEDGTSTTDSFRFRILPPWYRTWVAFLVYILLLAVVLFAVFSLESRRVERKQTLAMAEKNKEMHLMKVEIDQLEKEKLDLELKHKNQEIANLVISVARKNETLSLLKEHIRSVAVKLTKDNTAESKRELLRINNSIEANMEGDEVLKKFEEQFDLVNDNFMKRLSERHPDLSNNERLMCAYLKMNLTTKEIAPLLAISVRGVETMRYRIRKKFGLERDNSLTEYMNSL